MIPTQNIWNQTLGEKSEKQNLKRNKLVVSVDADLLICIISITTTYFTKSYQILDFFAGGVII